MLEFVLAGGVLMWPIVLCSIVALAIVAERAFVLQRSRVLPSAVLGRVRRAVKEQNVTDALLKSLQASPLGRVLAAGLVNRLQPRDIMKDTIEDVGAHTAHDLERNLNALGTIAAVTPLIGLLGTVLGMISVFANISSSGVGDPTVLAAGISKALVTTAAGVSVAIPTLMFYRYFRARVAALVVEMEQESMHLVEVLQRQREAEA